MNAPIGTVLHNICIAVIFYFTGILEVEHSGQWLLILRCQKEADIEVEIQL